MMTDWYGGGWMLFMMFGGILFTLLVVGAILFVMGQFGQGQMGRQPMMHPQVDPLETLKERYARGEITKEQFEQMKKDLS